MKWSGLTVAGLLLIWVGLIFGTSCTVVRPQEFFAWFHRHVFLSESAFHAFEVFWGVSWFAIVKGWHVAEFAVLTWLCSCSLTRLTAKRSTPVVIAAMLFCLGFAISDEWHQTFVPERYGTVSDVLIDSLGISLAGLILIQRRRKSLAPMDGD